MFQAALHTFGQRRLNVAVGPDNGPPLLLLHGVTRGWSDWSGVLGQLMPRWRVIAFDFRGHGASDHAGGYRVVDYARDAIDILRRVADEPAVVIGHSLGAMIAARVAAEISRAVHAVVLEDPPFHTMGDRIRETPQFDYFRQLERLVAGSSPVAHLAKQLAGVEFRSPDGERTQRLGELRDAAAIRFAAASLAKIDPAVLTPITAGRWLEGYDVAETVRAIRCPMLLLQADPSAGGMLIDADAEFVVANAADCIRHRFPATGHLIHGADAPAMMRVVIPFVESIRTTDKLVAPDNSEKTYRIDGHENRSRHDSNQTRPVS